ncbi:AAA domain-containing protein [Persicimonas caeni]|uniref:AAA domain-containing protein n=1 Tax=Persicimonas caeni TaxID=2292766 RepID=UPI00143DF4EB|nr:AAA domain-containing protein [Persicimonas caeni]
MTVVTDGVGERVRARLAQLRDRFVAVNLRSRSLRLRRASRTGAFDLARLPAVDALLEVLGHERGDAVRLAPRDEQLDQEIGRLAKAARRERMETGADHLAVGWPVVEGACGDGTWLRAPLLLYPVSLHRTEAGRLCWALSPRGLPEVNEPLIQTLARLERVQLSRGELLQFDDDGRLAVDAPTWEALVAYLSDAGLDIQAPASMPSLELLPPRDSEASKQASAGRFELHHHLVLGRFPLSASSIVLDYDELLDAPVDRLIQSAELGLARDLLLVDEASLNTLDPVGVEVEGAKAGDEALLGGLRRWQVLPSDASQDAVLSHLEAADIDPAAERGLIVQGPPGTGKSQLITNLLAACIARGKRVLLVCQKRAALDVVADRLTSLGLGEPLALVHDVQRDRNAVCEAIAETLDRGMSSGAVGIGSLQRQLEAAADDHSRAMERLERRARAAQEAFACLAGDGAARPGLAELLERALDDDGRELPDLAPWADAIERGELGEQLPFIESMAPETHTLAAPHPLAWRGDWAQLDDAQIEGVFERCSRLMELYDALDESAAQMTPGQAVEQAALWEQAAPLLDLFEEGVPRQVDEFAMFWVWTGGQTATGQWQRVMAALKRARAELTAVPVELIVASREDLEEWQAQLERLAELQSYWYRFFLPEYWRLRGLPGQILDRCTSLASTSTLPVNVAQLVDAALAWHDFLVELPDDNPLFDFGFDGDPTAIDDAVALLEAQHERVQCAHEVHAELGEVGAAYADLPTIDPMQDETPAQAPFFRAALADRRLARTLAEVGERLDALAVGLHADFRDQLYELAADGRRKQAKHLLAEFCGARQEAAEAARQDGVLAGRPDWVRAFLRHWRPGAGGGSGVAHDAQLAVERAWVDAWLDGRSVRAVEAPLVDADQRRRLAEAMTRCQQVADRGIIARFYGRLVDAFEGASGQSAAAVARRRNLRKLAEQARRKRNRMTLRQLIEAYWDRGLSEVRPVWCCSPESVAAMFPLRAGLFDVVIFDEASQCPVESALPALVRAETAVIAGDDQQMPPSHFFRAAPELADDDDSSVLASVSILALARACYPGVTLRWHYRSHHEELVAFSNTAFYGGQLVTAPPSRPVISADIEGLHWAPVDGLWEDNQNVAEARRVVELVVRFLAVRGPDDRPPTVGVVTFNQKQAELIERLLEERAATDDALSRLLARDRRRPIVDQLFVRNLENVQGDERDLIVMSPGYGPTEPGGDVHARFGPLNLAGGHKRLNVAITRARLGLWLVTSIRPERLDVSRTKHPGPRIFDAYLRFVRAHVTADRQSVEPVLAEAAELGQGGARWSRPKALSMPGLRAVGSRVRDELAEALERRGYGVRRDVGLGSQRLDLAVRRGPAEPWRVGVDCREFLRQPEPLARDVYLPAYWQRQGWTLTRVTPGMWLERADEVVEHILELVDK